MAVLPTPGSPTRIGLFLLRRLRICNVRLISSSRPMTGSNFPWRASSFKFFAYLFNALYSCDCVCEVIVSPLRRSFIAVIKPFSLRPASFNNFAAASFPCTIAKRICSGVTNSSPKDFNTDPARNTTLLASRLICCAGSPEDLGNLLINSSSLVCTRFMVTLFFFNKYSTGESCCSNKAFRICSVSIFGFCALNAACCAC